VVGGRKESSIAGLKVRGVGRGKNVHSFVGRPSGALEGGVAII